MISVEFQNNIDGAKTLINDWVEQFHPNPNIHWYNLQPLVYALELTNQIERAVPFMELIADDIMRQYKNPNALTGYFTRQTVLNVLKEMLESMDRVGVDSEKIKQYYERLL